MTPLDVDDLVRASLKEHFANPDLFNDKWELEPLTPLPSPFQSPTIYPCDSLPLPAMPTLNDVSSMPVIDPSRATVATLSVSRPSNVAPPLAPQPGSTHAKKGKTKRRAKRRKAAATPFDRKLKSSTSDSVAGTGMLKSNIKAESLHIARGAYVGRRQDRVEPRYWTLERLQAAGINIQKWDGRCVVLSLLLQIQVPQHQRSSRFVIVDKHGRIIALFAGPPDGAKDWDQVTERATVAMENARKQCTFKHEQEVHSRGLYPTVGVGSSFGGGSLVRRLYHAHPLHLA